MGKVNDLQCIIYSLRRRLVLLMHEYLSIVSVVILKRDH